MEAMSDRKSRSSATGQVTLQDVARHLGVSAITVSRALKTPQRVSEALRARIMCAVSELGYRPNHAARSLASARSDSVLVLVPSLTNEVFVDTLSGIHEVLIPRGYQALIGNTHYSPQEEEKQLGVFLGHNPDGILLTGLDHTPRVREWLAGCGVPVVYMMEIDDARDSRCVGLSQFDGGQAITRYLVGKGYRRIAYVAAQADPRTLKRGEGYRAALREAGLYDPKREIWVPTPSSIGLGASLLDRLLKELPDCDAVFCCNDDLAQGMLFQCQRRNVAVPGQLAICGFNDLAASAWTNPPITTIATPRYAIGREAAQMLLDAIDGDTPPCKIDLGFSLVERLSA
jgi:LacI family gluconate utilization system Gnt-I transcriptional repressor